MELKIVVANPAGNITAFVLNQVPKSDYIAVSQKILSNKTLHVEQVGFVALPKRGGQIRLEMMGGEFCGNATRSIGMLTAKELGKQGRCTIFVECSGCDKVLPVTVDMDAGEAETIMPKPLEIKELDAGELGHLPLISFEGILHVIAPQVKPSQAYFNQIRGLIPSDCYYDALGVMFYDVPSNYMFPAVYVKATDSLVFESSCGSGTVAAAVWRSRLLSDGVFSYEVQQPGGILRATVKKGSNTIQEVTMGGPVTLGPEQLLSL